MSTLPDCVTDEMVVYFVRHGEAQHNVAMREISHDEVYSEKWFDPSLTDFGRQQASRVVAALTAVAPDADPDASPGIAQFDLLLISPLRRTLQTSEIIYSHLPDRKVPHIVTDMIRERFGLTPCDRRSPRHLLAAEFPWANLDHLPDGPDPKWSLERETPEQLDARAAAFLRWLRDRQERTLLVVSHDGFLYHTFRQLNASGNADSLRYADRRFDNCEVRRVCIPRSSLPP